MRIGITGGGRDADRVVEQAIEAEQYGFSHIWYSFGVLGDPLVAMALAGRATTRASSWAQRPADLRRASVRRVAESRMW